MYEAALSVERISLNGPTGYLVAYGIHSMDYNPSNCMKANGISNRNTNRIIRTLLASISPVLVTDDPTFFQSGLHKLAIELKDAKRDD